MKHTLLMALLLLNYIGFSQNNKFDEIKKNIVYGGSIALSFGEASFVDLSPLIGYKITPKLVSGFGVTYQYLNYPKYNYETSNYGGRLYSEYILIDNLSEMLQLNLLGNGGLYIHAEYEIIYFETQYTIPNLYPEQKYSYAEAYLFGGGLNQKMGRSILSILFLWDLNPNGYHLYRSPIIRIGVSF